MERLQSAYIVSQQGPASDFLGVLNLQDLKINNNSWKMQDLALVITKLCL